MTRPDSRTVAKLPKGGRIAWGRRPEAGVLPAVTYRLLRHLDGQLVTVSRMYLLASSPRCWIARDLRQVRRDLREGCSQVPPPPPAYDDVPLPVLYPED